MRAGSAFVVAFALLSGAPPVSAQLQRWVDERGVIHYADAAPNPARTAAAPTLSPASVSSASTSRRASAPARRTQAAALLPGSPSSVDRATAKRLPALSAR